MKKKILSVALIAMSLVSFSGIAQNINSENSNVKDNIENVKGRKAEKKGDKKDGNKFDKKGDRKEDRKFKGEKKNPYEGLTLNDSQKQKLQQLDAKRMAARQEQKKVAKEEKMARKQEKQLKDSLKFVERQAAKKSYLEEVKAIVGPDQYVIFLENYFVNGNGGNHKNAMKQGPRGDKKDYAHKNQVKNNRGDNRADNQRNRS